MTAPCPSLCTPWATTDDVTRLRGTTTPDVTEFLLPASDLLFEASRRLFPGSCQDTVRPCARRSVADVRPAWHGTVLDGLPGSNFGWGGLGWQQSWGVCLCNMPLSRQCGCSGLSEITLGGEPATSIVEVLIDGEVLDPAKYTVHDNRWLVRVRDPDGTWHAWPCCQDMTKPSTEPGTWQVTFTYGTPPPSDGVLACVDLALELARLNSEGDCALPPRITSMIRQGVQVALLDPLAVVAAGGTGVYSVDLFLQPYRKRTRPATVHVPAWRNPVSRDTGA